MKEYNNYKVAQTGEIALEENLRGIAEDSLGAIEKYESESGEKIGIEKNVDRLKEIIGTDIRNDLSPRLFSFISGVVSVIEDIEKK